MDDNSNCDYDRDSNIIEEKISRSNGDTYVRKYNKGKLLGKGGFAKCYQVTCLENNRNYAAKIIEKSTLTKSRTRQKLISEIKIHKSLQHTNIVSFEHVFEDSQNVYILLEVCKNQTLNELLKRRKRLTELEVQCYLIQMVHALKYMHENKIIHRDLKLGNLFLSDKMEIKVGDFGLAAKVEFEGERKKTICGTPNYIAPEILEGRSGHSYEVDVWSLGVIIYTMLIGKPPFETSDVKATYKKIRANNYSFPEHIPLSEGAKGLITKILALDPSRRPTLDEILAHPFLNGEFTIPKLLPVSTIVCPPSASYVRQFVPQGFEVRVAVQPQRLYDTAPNALASLTRKLPLTQRENPGNVDKTEPKRLNSVIALEETINKDRLSLNIKPGEGLTSTAATMNYNSTGTVPGHMRSNTASQKDLKFPVSNFKTQQGFNLGDKAGLETKLNKENGIPARAIDVYVKKWVDYSSKYGMGYLLSNGAIGVFFNDASKIVMDAAKTKFCYYDRQAKKRKEGPKNYTFKDYPEDLKKKVTLLDHFKGYLEGENKSEAVCSVGPFDPKSSSDELVFVKKWTKTKHAIIFRLTNKIVQVVFADKTETILNSENKTVVYVNKKGERSEYPLKTAMESQNQEMTKRLKYTKEILTQIMVTNEQGKGSQSRRPEHIQALDQLLAEVAVGE